MDNFIMDVLKKEAGQGDPLPRCPDASDLIEAGRNQAGRLDMGVLARHLLVCARCAGRWHAVQSDAHLGVAELYALLRLKKDDFIRLRAEDHLKHCPSCAHAGELLRRLVVPSGARSVHFDNLGLLLRLALPAASALRSPTQPLRAAVLRRSGEPVVAQDAVAHLEIAVRQAVLDSEGKLTIDLELPAAGYHAVQLALWVKDLMVLFKPVSVKERRASFWAQTTARGPEMTVSPSHMAVWIFEA